MSESAASTDRAYFVAGTKIMTLRGEIPVEAVRANDRVLTLSGNGSPLKPIAALRSLAVDPGSHPEPALVTPVRVRAGAIADGVPIRDLVVAPGHSLSIEDDDGQRVLVPALFLVNGATILSEPMNGPLAYHAIALEEHDILMADGMAAESAVDVPAPPEPTVVPLRRAEAVAPPPTPADLSPTARHDRICAPQILGAAIIPLHARLLARAEEAGHVQTDNPALVLLAGDEAVAPISEGGGEYVYLLPPDCAQLRLQSRTCAPADIQPATGDRRRLGIALARIFVDGVEMPLDAPALRSGLLPAEHNGDDAWRWTTGEAVIALEPRGEETTLELHVHQGWSWYWEG